MKPANDNAPVSETIRVSALPYGVAPRGLNRREASAYFGVSPALFDELVRDGRAPSPRMVNSRTIWDRLQLDAAFEALPVKGSSNPWDDAFGTL